MSASLFGQTSPINVNVNGTVVPQSFTATTGQVLFSITSFNYTPGTNSLLVFINGQKQVVGRDFAETSSSSFTLIEGCVAGDYVDVIGFPQIELTQFSSSAAVTYTPAGTGAAQRTVQDKLRESVSVLDFGAVGDGVTDDTAAFQAAAAACLSGNKALYIPNPTVEYIVSAPIDFVYATAATRGIRIFGNSFGAYYSNSGSIIKYTGTTGYLFRVLGRNVGDGGSNAGSPMSVEISGLTLKGNGACQGAILIQRAWYVRVENNSFFDFVNSNYGVIVANAVGPGEAFSGEMTIRKNNFQSSGVGIWLTGLGGVVNVVRIQDNVMLDQVYGVKSDFSPGPPYTSNIQLFGNHFEGTQQSDIYSAGAAQGWAVIGNYFEQNNPAQNAPRVHFEGATNRGIVVLGNTFFKDLGAAGTALVRCQNGDGVTIIGNFSAYGGSSDRYSVDLISCANSRGEIMVPPSGTGFPLRINNYLMRSGVVDTDFLKVAAGGSGGFVGLSSGDGYPGATVCTATNQYNKNNGWVTFSFKAVVTTKSGAGTSFLIGVLPLSNSQNEVVFPVKVKNVAGTQPFYGVLPGGSTVATVYDATGAAVNYQTAVSMGSEVQGVINYFTQE